MIDVAAFVDSLEKNGVDFYAGVPDSLLKSFCAYLTDRCGANHVIAANEGGAVGLAAGHHLATGKMACVYMQNSGQGNAVNPLCSLADPDVYSIPMVLLVGWRGEPGVRDEPQHAKQGKVTVKLFEALGIPTCVLTDEVKGEGQGQQWKDQVSSACAQAKRENRPVALIVRKGLFGEYKLQNKKPDIAALKREAAIEAVLECLGDEAVVVSTTGMISREVYEARERQVLTQSHGDTEDSCAAGPQNNSVPPCLCVKNTHSRDFLTVGSMGHALMIALGVARDCTAKNSNRYVVCLDGDGASIMQMGNMAIAGAAHQPNLIHIVLNNAAHDSVGGQPTVGDEIDLCKIAEACGYYVADKFVSGTKDDLKAMLRERLDQAIYSWACDGDDVQTTFIEIKVAKGARADLGRPKEPPQANKARFMETLGVRA